MIEKADTGIITARDVLRNKKYKATPLPKHYKQILGNLPDEFQWTMLLHGAEGSGKSTYAMMLAKEFTKRNYVIYGNFEEAIGPTLIEKLKLISKDRTCGEDISKIHLLKNNTESELWRQLNTGKYKYCVVDSLSEITNSDKKIIEFWEKVKKYPKISFILIGYARRKDKNYRGMSSIGHIVDINQSVVEGIVWNNKNRFLDSDCEKTDGYNVFKKTLINNRNRK
jgi:predicted ATP-dependent serine protease